MQRIKSPLLMLLIIRSRKAPLLSDISFFGSFIFRFFLIISSYPRSPLKGRNCTALFLSLMMSSYQSVSCLLHGSRRIIETAEQRIFPKFSFYLDHHPFQLFVPVLLLTASE